MSNLEPNNRSTDTAPPEVEASSLTEQEPVSHPAQNTETVPITSAQAEQILAELKTIKQNLLWILLLGGFFAARAFFFHY